MKRYEINILFKTKEELDVWEKEHIVNGKYNGEYVTMVHHDVKTKRIILDYIETID